LVKTRSVPKHPRHILYIANIPISNVFVKVFVVAGIAVSGVIVDGVNDIPAGIVDFLAVSIKMVLENP
jgi:hypothetical protein